MKAWYFNRYGGPEQLQLRDFPKPVPASNEVLVKVHALSLNPAEWHTLRGALPARPPLGLFRPKPFCRIPSGDVAGTVEAVGQNITHVKPGDAVYGRCEWAGLAQYVSLPENRVALAPSNLSMAEAASIPLAGLSALQGLQHAGPIQAGTKVLINGASGGIGTAAVQLAKAFGAHVSAVCSGRNAELVKSLGADAVIDYTQEDFTQSGQQYPLVCDLIGNHPARAIRRALTPNGHAAVVGYTKVSTLLTVLLPTRNRGGKTVGMVQVETSREQLDMLREFRENGSLRAVIDRHFPFDRLPEAMELLSTRRARGKVVVEL